MNPINPVNQPPAKKQWVTPYVVSISLNVAKGGGANNTDGIGQNRS